MLRSVQVELMLDEEQRNIVRRTCEEFNKSFNIAAKYCLESNSGNYYEINKLCYYDQRSQCPDLPAAMVQASTKSAAGNYKVCRTKMVRTKMSYLIDQLTMTLRGNQLTFSTVEKRIRTIISIPVWFAAKYPDRKLRSGIVKYSTTTIHVVLQFQIPDMHERNTGDIVGLDRGMYQIVSTSRGENYSSKKVRALKRKMLYNRRCLQKKGTHSAKRKLRKLRGKEKRFVRDINHCITKKLANDVTVKTYVLEDLTDVKINTKGKKLNQRLNGWSYYELEMFLQYKCEATGIEVVKVSPRYTSQICNQCGQINKNNRHNNHYSCSCGYHEHADINAAKNIRDRYISQLLQAEQAEFNQPIATDEQFC